ncbi:MAG: PIG-L family deacetylase, partial [Bacteroidetes bacterium]|nr:PIG-L family deacetylase [Bacteroidota bacterium]
MKKGVATFLFCLFTILYSPFAKAQSEVTSSEIRHEIEGLKTVGSVMYLAAHPDDENTRLIAYLSKGRHLKTTYLSLTRGDGGQNLIGTEKGDLLGVVRSHELGQARVKDGGEQCFTRAIDFGYSKTANETFSFWNKEEVLKDVVWNIRKVKPDVIITRFPPDYRAGHGHHTASAMLAIEAYKAAADKNFKFNDARDGELKPWKVKRVVWNTS